MWPEVLKICLQNLKIPLRPYFKPIRARICLENRFYVLFLISDKNKEFDTSQLY